MNANKKALSFWLIFAFLLCSASPAYAGSPSGTNWFQLLASPYTGGDNTGDGGTGLPADYNYYYVGQTWTETMQISSDNTNASNIWVDYDGLYTSSTNLLTGTYFANWWGQSTTSTGGTNYRIKSTGYRTSGNSTGVGSFGSVQFTAYRPTAASYGVGSPTTYDINIGTVGLTTESNISYLGADILEDAEDFNFHIWADTIKPYGLNPNPSNGSSGIAVDANYSFDLRDSKNGEGDNTGVGTGVNTTEPPGTLTFDDGGGAVSYTSYDSFACSGVWGTNLCSATVNPPSPLAISGDSRNWEYNTSYTVNVGGFRDYASASQDQLGDANGPNTMDSKTWTFTTESDTIPPQVIAESPTRGSTGNSVSTNVSVDVVDKKAHPGSISGTGVNSATCRIRINSPSFGTTDYQQGDAGVTVTAIDYGYRFTINPATNFAQNETVAIRVSDCQDLATNTMVTDNYTFSTADSDGPYVDTVLPANDATITQSDTISFHIKDSGIGIDLSNTVIYVNGTYYTNSGGAGTVTTNGTRITFASSLNFNGGNYVGDTTARTGSASDYTFTIDPQTNFAVGESVPVIIYTRDLTGNLMERYVYALTVSGAGCPSGSTYCGTDSAWNAGLGQCIGTGGGSGSGGGGGGGSTPTAYINPSTASATQIDESSVLVVWYSSFASDSRVVYGTNSSDLLGSAPNYGYSQSTATVDSNSVYHSMVVNGLRQGELYYFRPISNMNGQAVFGPEMAMSPVFGTDIQAIVCEKQDCPVCEVKPPVTQPTKPAVPSVVHPATPEEQKTQIVKILGIVIGGIEMNGTSAILINGTAGASSKLKMIIY